MFWIDKHNKRRRKEGHNIVNLFIHEVWNPQDKRYINCTYATFKRNGKMEELLYREQRGFCCYCMRHLEVGKHTSLEHVLPHNSINKQRKPDFLKINYYKRFNKIFERYVIYKHINGSKIKWHSGPPYPHFCAYENLVLSCDGSLFTDEDKEKNYHASKIHLCCNEHRGNELILPLFFIRNINEIILYNSDGTIGISPKVTSSQLQIELSKTIESLALDHERLKIIRQTWFYIAQSRLYNVEQVKMAINDETLRRNIMIDSGIPISIVRRIQHPIYWSLLYEYFWFYKYFS